MAKVTENSRYFVLSCAVGHPVVLCKVLPGPPTIPVPFSEIDDNAGLFNPVDLAIFWFVTFVEYAAVVIDVLKFQDT